MTKFPKDPCRLVRQVNKFCEREGLCEELLHLPDKPARGAVDNPILRRSLTKLVHLPVKPAGVRRAIIARARPGRRGVTSAEMAVVLVVFATCVLGMLDLGMAVFRYHMLAEASRRGARLASVHGKLADRLGPWGPAEFTVSADNTSNPLAAGVRPVLTGVDASDVTIQAQWPDAGNDPIREHRVRVSVSSTYHPVTLFLFSADIPLQASSTMVITH